MRAGSQGEDFREFVAWLQGDCVKGRELDVSAFGNHFVSQGLRFRCVGDYV